MRLHASECRPITDAEIGWCAGFLDGEGCLSVHRTRTNKLTVQFRAVNVEPEPIERLQRILGGTVRCWGVRRPPRVPAWCWYCRSRDLEGVLTVLLPHLTVKHDQAEAALAYLRPGLIGPAEENAITLALTTGSKRRRRRLVPTP